MRSSTSMHRFVSVAGMWAGLMACVSSTTSTTTGDPPPPSDAGTLADASMTSQTDASVGDAATTDASRPPDAGRRDAAVDDAGPQPCNPALAITPAMTAVLPLDLLTFTPSGGSGAYHFEITTNASGAIINPLTGAYLSGELFGTTDIITLTDERCTGSTTASVQVVEPMTVFPTVVEVAPGSTFQFEVRNGLGPFTYSMVLAPAGGMVSSMGVYSVGSGTGRDQVRVTDTGSGQFIDAYIDVVMGAMLRPQTGSIYVPVGSTFAPAILGGSGRFNGVVMGSGIAFDGGVVMGLSPGTATIQLTDVITRQSTTLTAVAVGPQSAPSNRVGDQTGIAWAWGPGDVNGDGFEDALVGVPEADVTGVQSGAVYLYLGSSTGLSVEPAQVYAGAARRDEYGRTFTTADFNGDGLVDLAVGAYLADVGQTDNGAVYIHYGRANAIWDTVPDQTLSGRFASDQFGYALTACDFNDDNLPDLAVGAVLAEDRTVNPQAQDQGGVAIFLGYPDGFLMAPDQTVYGQITTPDAGWAGTRDLRIGNALASGDVDGDGKCDLAVSSLNYRLVSPRTNDGVAFIYKGVGPSGVLRGGIAQNPSRAIAGISANDPSSQFGRYLALGDVDGDGLADLVASHINHDKDAGIDQNPGAVRIFAGGPLGDSLPSSLEVPEDADWTFEGPNNQDNAGWFVAVGEMTGDAILDVISGNLQGEGITPDAGLTPDGGRIDAGQVAQNAGSVTIFAGRTGAFPDVIPTRTIGGLAANDRFGQALAPLGDVDGDSFPDLIAFAGRADAYGLDVGVPYYVPGDVARPMVPLSMPGFGAGQQLGRDADIVGDVDGDGREDLVVGAPQADPMVQGVNAGTVFLYKGTGTGFSSTPDLTILGFPGHSGADQLGYGVSRAGDFNNDGIADFAVIARSDDRPTTFDMNYANPTMCAGSRNDAGSVFIFLGKSNGLPDVTPAFVWYGPQGGQVIEVIAGGFDFNGDGFDDLVVGSPSWDNGSTGNVGGFAIISGRSATGMGKITVICDTLVGPVLGLAANDNLGRSVASMGDLNNDGCGDVVIGANAEDFGKTDQGSVRVVYGAGGTGCPAAAQYVLLTPDVAGSQAGFSVAGGEDVDGDGTEDLATGGVGFRVGANTTGAAWIVPGAYINSLAKEAITDVMPTVNVFADPNRTGVYRIDGDVGGERFGSSVALVAGASGNGRAALAVGGPFGAIAGPASTGGVRVYRFVATTTMDPEGLRRPPIASLGGETGRPGSQMGIVLRAGRVGMRSAVIAGALEANAVGLDEGTTYVMVLP